MGIYEFVRDCRTEEEKKNKDFSRDLFCTGTWTTLVANDTGSIDCSCRKHRLIRGNKFTYDLSSFSEDHKEKESIEYVDVEFVRSVNIQRGWNTIIIAQLLVNIDLSHVDNIRYYTCFGNEDIPSVAKHKDGKYLITLPFSKMSIIIPDLSNEDYREYYKAREQDKISEYCYRDCNMISEINFSFLCEPEIPDLSVKNIISWIFNYLDMKSYPKLLGYDYEMNPELNKKIKELTKYYSSSLIDKNKKNYTLKSIASFLSGPNHIIIDKVQDELTLEQLNLNTKAKVTSMTELDRSIFENQRQTLIMINRESLESGWKRAFESFYQQESENLDNIEEVD